jgi:hypothetical protein
VNTPGAVGEPLMVIIVFDQTAFTRLVIHFAPEIIIT